MSPPQKTNKQKKHHILKSAINLINQLISFISVISLNRVIIWIYSIPTENYPEGSGCNLQEQRAFSYTFGVEGSEIWWGRESFHLRERILFKTSLEKGLEIQVQILMPFYKSMKWPHLEYREQFWLLCLQNGVAEHDKAQNKVGRMIRVVEYHSYWRNTTVFGAS